MSEVLLAASIGGAFAFLGVLVGIFANTWIENQKAKRERLREIRLRLVDERIQTSEVMDFIRSQRKRKWPYIWKQTRPDLSRANLAEVDLRHQDLQGVIFFRANLNKSDLDGADLTNADLRKANLSEASLTEAKLCKADLRESDLSGASLDWADLQEANLVWAKLIGANLPGAKLCMANLSKADLQKANLPNVDLTGANLSEADLRNANLSKTNPSKANLNAARCNQHTLWLDSDFDPNQAHVVFVTD